jgi:hypothetical protein
MVFRVIYGRSKRLKRCHNVQVSIFDTIFSLSCIYFMSTLLYLSFTILIIIFFTEALRVYRGKSRSDSALPMLDWYHHLIA